MWPRVASGQAVQATFSVTAPTADANSTLTATASTTVGAGRFNPGSDPETLQAEIVQPELVQPEIVQNVYEPVTVVSAPVEINEAQTGTSTTPNQQFVELYNSGVDSANVSGWQLEYTSAAAG